MNYFRTKDRHNVLKSHINKMDVGDRVLWNLYFKGNLITQDTWTKITNDKITETSFTPAIFRNEKGIEKFQGDMIDLIEHEHLSSETDTYRLNIDFF